MSKSTAYARLFVASFVLNLFLCGIVAGQFLQRGFPPPHMMHRPPAQDLEGVLPPAKVAELQEMMQKHFTARREGEADINDIRGEMDALIGAEPFDAAAFTAKAAEMHAAQNRIATDMGSDMAAFLSTLPQADRLKLADHFRKHMPPMPPPHPPR